MTGGILGNKGQLVHEMLWSTAFYTHISMGGIALLTGWIQFSKRIRSKYLKFHRRLGRIYLIAVLLSGISGLCVAYYATGGLVAQLGFGLLATLWLYTAWKAYSSIKSSNIEAHKNWMIRNYALTWAAVMLRIWLPLFQFGFGIEFLVAYPIIAWLCWVPNLIIAELFFIRKL